MSEPTNGVEYEIPKECLAGVVVNEGPDFRVEVQKVPVPEIGMHAQPGAHTWLPPPPTQASGARRRHEPVRN